MYAQIEKLALIRTIKDVSGMQRCTLELDE